MIYFSHLPYHSCCQPALPLNQLAKSFAAQTDSTQYLVPNKKRQVCVMKNYKIALKMAKTFVTMVHINKIIQQMLIPARVVDSICNHRDHLRNK